MKELIRNTVVTTSLALAMTHVARAQVVQLNEIYCSHSGTDFFEFIEIKGPPNYSLDNHLVLIVDGDFDSSPSEHGILDRAWDLSGHTIDASRYFVLGNTQVTPKDFDIGAQDIIEEGTSTFYLVNAGTPANTAALVALIGTQIDPDGNMITVIPSLASILDNIGIADDHIPNWDPDIVYDGAFWLGPDNSGMPAGIFCGFDAPWQWCPEFLDFNAANNQSQPRTPKAQNSPCPSAPPVVSSYCTPGTTSNGCTATMGFVGTPSITIGPGGFVVTTSGIEGQKYSLMFYGIAGPSTIPWGTSSSFMCVKSPRQRMQVNDTGGTAGACDGTASLDFLAYTSSNPGGLGVPFGIGDRVWFQCWFRDPPTPTSTMLSDGLEITFVP